MIVQIIGWIALIFSVIMFLGSCHPENSNEDSGWILNYSGLLLICAAICFK